MFYWLPYETTTAQGIPHDIHTMQELWGVTEYRRRNKYFTAVGLQTLIADLSDDDDSKKADLLAQSSRLLDMYNAMSDQYHSEKAGNQNNTLVLS